MSEDFIKIDMHANLRCDQPTMGMRFQRYSPYWKRPEAWDRDDHSSMNRGMSSWLPDSMDPFFGVERDAEPRRLRGSIA